MSKYCIACGAELEDNAVFCDECGAKQETQQPSNNMSVNEQMANTAVQSETKMRQSGFGIASFIFGIISIITLGSFYFPEIIGIAFGIAGLKDKSKKHGMAKVGLIMSIIGTVILILVFVFIFALM